MVIQISPRRRAVGASEPCHDVVVDGVRLAYDDEGEGPPLVCLHAIGHGASDFAGLRRRLAGRHRVIALDWPGHGSSDDDRVPASAGRYTVLLAGVLDALGIERAIILGNSIGGAVAIRFAAAHPDRVRALVLANPGGLDRGGGGRLNRAVTGMIRKRRGRIVLISSVVGLYGSPGQVNYAASKAGLVGIARSVTRELGSRGVRANVVAPGYVKTQLTDVLPEEATKAMLDNTPLGRLGEPEDIAGAVRFLCSDAAAFITGEVLLVDGGLGM